MGSCVSQEVGDKKKKPEVAPQQVSGTSFLKIAHSASSGGDHNITSQTSQTSSSTVAAINPLVQGNVEQSLLLRALYRQSKPKPTQRQVSVLERLDTSLLLHFHPQRVQVLEHLRGGFTHQDMYIPTAAERRVARETETHSGLYEGQGHLYFLELEDPTLLPLSAFQPFDETRWQLYRATYSPAATSEDFLTASHALLLSKVDAMEGLLRSGHFEFLQETAVSLHRPLLQAGCMQLCAVLMQISESANNADVMMRLLQQLDGLQEAAYTKLKTPPDLTSMIELLSVITQQQQQQMQEETACLSTTEVEAFGMPVLLPTRDAPFDAFRTNLEKLRSAGNEECRTLEYLFRVFRFHCRRTSS